MLTFMWPFVTFQTRLCSEYGRWQQLLNMITPLKLPASCNVTGSSCEVLHIQLFVKFVVDLFVLPFWTFNLTLSELAFWRRYILGNCIHCFVTLRWMVTFVWPLQTSKQIQGQMGGRWEHIVNTITPQKLPVYDVASVHHIKILQENDVNHCPTFLKFQTSWRSSCLRQ